jgi:gag-polyprotein putative aspartyl protease
VHPLAQVILTGKSVTWFFVLAVSIVASAQTVPFKSHSGLILIQVQVDNKPMTMVLDTGAVSTFIASEAKGFDNVTTAQLKKNGNTMVIAGKAAVRNVTISIDGGKALNENVMVISLKQISDQIGVKVDGMIGQDFLSVHSAINIDYRRHEVTFTK